MILIDGSLGEGGGQILRSALALSMVTGKPFRIEKIRAGRDKPGLLRQHLTAVNAAAAICSATVLGASISSQLLTFTPGPIKPGEYTFSIGTAGSTTLVLQSVLPALLTAPGPSTITLEGGTHNPFAPPVDFLEKTFLPLIRKMGPAVHVVLEKPGFYPAGGGRIQVHVEPTPALKPLHILERGEFIRSQCVALLAGLPRNIADREINLVKRMMSWSDDCFQIRTLPDNCGPGNVLSIELESQHLTEVFTGFGQRGARAEAVADDALQQAKKYIAANVPVGRHLADQLLLPLALANGGSFLTLPLSRHSSTNIQIIQQFLNIGIKATDAQPHQCLVEIGPR